MKTRLISGIVYCFLIFLCTNSLGGNLISELFGTAVPQKYLFAGLMLLLYLAVMIEACFMMAYDNKLFIAITTAVGFIPIYLFLKLYINGESYIDQSFDFNVYIKSFLFVLCTIIAIITAFKYSDEITAFDTSKLIFNVIYIGIPFGLVYAFPTQDEFFGSEVFYIFLLLWMSDTSAYLIGTKFGKTKIFPEISPKKSREGLIAGMIGTIVLGIIIEILLPELRGNYIAISIVVAIFAPFGDLMASKLKRVFDVKDSSQLIPGHGGFLDRLDSFIICVPFIFLYFIIFK